ncbi:unknown [Ligilactobacillus ruminis CAG:367]|nr:unknown [Ligilactobacillus ruminis CAG:367]
MISQHVSDALQPVLDGVPVQEQLPCRFRDASITVQQIGADRFQKVPALGIRLQSGQRSQASHHRILAPVNQLPALRRKLQLPLQHKTPVRKDVPDVLQSIKHRQISLAAVSRVVQAAAPHNHGVRPDRAHVGNHPHHHLLRLAQGMRRAQTHDRHALKDGAENRVRILSHEFTVLLHMLLDLARVRAAEQPQLMNRRNVDMEDARQPPHPERLVLQNGAHQLVHRVGSALSAPDVDADAQRISCLFQLALLKRHPDPDQSQLIPLARIGPDCLTVRHGVRHELAAHAPSFKRKRQVRLKPLPHRILQLARPRGQLQQHAVHAAKHNGTPKLHAQHPQRRRHRLLTARRRRHPVQYVRNKRCAALVLIDALGDVRDQLAVPQITLPLRHADEHEVILIRHIDEPLVNPRQIHADVVQHQPHLAAFNQPPDVLALHFHVIRAVDETGYDEFAAGVSAPCVRKQLVDQNLRLRRLQHRDRRHDPSHPA